MLEHQNIKTFLQKFMFQIVIKKVKNTMLWTYVISEEIGEEIVGRFYKKKS